MRFKIGSTQFTVSFLFCCVLALLILFDNAVLLYSFLMVCAHEGAHLLAMTLCGARVKAVRFEPFGIIIEKEDEDLPLLALIFISAAGCMLNILLAAVFFCLYLHKQGDVFMTLFSVNVCLFALNILPIYGLDGGQILYLLLQTKGEEFADITVKTVSYVCCALLFVAGMILCFKVRFNPSICLISFVLFVQTLLRRVDIEK